MARPSVEVKPGISVAQLIWGFSSARSAGGAIPLAKQINRVLDSAAERAMGASKSYKQPGRPSPRIFVVDDEPILLELAEKVLGGLQCEIQTFNNPEVALQKFSSAERPPDLLITDFAMHEMDGLDLIRACRRLNPKQKIILVSGTVDESVFAGSGIKPDRFLAKPYEPSALTDLVQELLKD